MNLISTFRVLSQSAFGMVSLDPLSLTIHEAHQQGQTNQDLDFGTTPIIFHDSQGRTLVGANHKDGTFYVEAMTILDDLLEKGPRNATLVLTVNNDPDTVEIVSGVLAAVLDDDQLRRR